MAGSAVAIPACAVFLSQGRLNYWASPWPSA
jgi:hypothetical protein